MKYLKQLILLLGIVATVAGLTCLIYGQQPKQNQRTFSPIELTQPLSNHADQMKILWENQKDFDQRLKMLEKKIQEQALTSEALQAHAKLICDTLRKTSTELRNELRYLK